MALGSSDVRGFPPTHQDLEPLLFVVPYQVKDCLESEARLLSTLAVILMVKHILEHDETIFAHRQGFSYHTMPEEPCQPFALVEQVPHCSP